MKSHVHRTPLKKRKKRKEQKKCNIRVFIKTNIINLNNKIREWGSTLYVRLAHAVPTTQYKAFTALSTNWLSESSTSDVHLQGAADFKARIISQ